MTNPKTELRAYLEILFHRFLHTKSLYQELNRFYEWKKPQRFAAYSLGAYSFELAEYSLLRIVLVEMSALLSTNEKRSLVDWLKKAREHAASLDPTCYNPGYSRGDRLPVEVDEYRALIDEHQNHLDAEHDVIDRVKVRRDKAIAHFDSDYFKNPKDLDIDFPLTYADINHLMDVVSDILRKHYSCLFNADPRMEILSIDNIDKVLNYARAFQRVRKDRALIKKGFKPVAYLGDRSEE